MARPVLFRTVASVGDVDASARPPERSYPEIMAIGSQPEHIQHRGVALFLDLRRVHERAPAGGVEAGCDGDVLLVHLLRHVFRNGFFVRGADYDGLAGFIDMSLTSTKLG